MNAKKEYMRNFKVLIAGMLMACFSLSVVHAQMSKSEYNQETKRTAKEVKKAEKKLTSRTLKSAKREAKKLARQGYTVAPGAVPLEKQLENAWIKTMEQDDKTAYPKYVVANGNAVGETITAAKLQANEVAKFELAGTISTNVAALIEGNIANAQLDNREAASVTEVTGAIKNLIVQEIGRVIQLLEIYKKIGKNVEVNVRIAYNGEMAVEAAKKVIRTELKDRIKLQHEKLEKLMKF
jgi:predicted neutral ceramidase superfamily lipid hydrolase